MALEKFPRLSEIAWGKIKELRVNSEKGSYSFEFDLHGRRQRMTITVAPNSTSYTLSTEDGNPVVHATQKGREVRVIDFSEKPRLVRSAAKIRKIGKIRKK